MKKFLISFLFIAAIAGCSDDDNNSNNVANAIEGLELRNSGGHCQEPNFCVREYEIENYTAQSKNVTCKFTFNQFDSFRQTEVYTTTVTCPPYSTTEFEIAMGYYTRVLSKEITAASFN